MSIVIPEFSAPVVAERFIAADDFPVGMTGWADLGDVIAAIRVEGYRCPNVVVVRAMHDKSLRYFSAEELHERIEAA